MKKLGRPVLRRAIHFPMDGNSEMFPEIPKIRRILMVLLFLAVVVFPLFMLYRIANPGGLLPRPARNFPDNRDPMTGFSEDSSSENTDLDNENVSLAMVLKEAAMEDGTVILTTLNEAWAAPGSVIDLFLESFRNGVRIRRLLKHLVIMALDRNAFARCLTIHTHCFPLNTDGVDFSGEKFFMTPDYLRMMWRRIDFLRSVLEMGYNFVFTDADIMWFRDPFPHFYPDADFQIACDHFLGSSIDLQNRPNGGFNFARSNNRTIEFYKFWYSSREVHPGYHDQDVLNTIKYNPIIREIGLKLRFLNTAYFGGLCEPSKDLNQVCTMHANCCYGLGNKLHDLRIMLEDWRRFMSLPPRLKRLQLSSWRVPQNCRYNPELFNYKSKAVYFHNVMLPTAGA